MKIPVIIDGLRCEAEISRFNWFIALISMAIHRDNPAKWYFFHCKNITHPNYRDRDYLNISINDILIGKMYKEGLHQWLIDRLN